MQESYVLLLLVAIPALDLLWNLPL